MKELYTASATATSGRDGRIVAAAPKLDLNLCVPKELGGPGGEGTNPEQLFAAGYAACFGGALALVARQRKVATGVFSVTAQVSLGQTADHRYGLAIDLQGAFPDLGREEAEALMRAAHEVCPYSNATRGNVQVALSVA